MKKLFENWRKHLNEAAVPHSANHIVKKMKKTGKSAMETLKSLTTDLSDEEAKRWLERHKDEMESAKQDLDEAAYEPGRAVSGVDQEIDREEAVSYQYVRDTFKSDLQDVGMDWLMDDPNEDMYSVLDQLQRNSDSPDEFADNIKQWLNNQDPAQIGYTNLGDDVLNET